jgi:erythromycin esterase-like protein
MAAARDVRDRAQADNLDWILNREGENAKVLVFASRYHLSAAALKAGLISADGQECDQEVAGTYLRRRWDKKLLTICNVIGRGECGGGGFDLKLGRAAPGSIDRLAGEVGPALFALDLRAAPAEVADWLNEEQCLVAGPQVLKLAPGRAFDALYYIDTVTPACPESVTPS